MTAKIPLGRLESVAQTQPLWLPGGWVMTEVEYDCRTGGRTDKMYIHLPTAAKVRSRPELFRHEAMLRKRKRKSAVAGSDMPIPVCHCDLSVYICVVTA